MWNINFFITSPSVVRVLDGSARTMDRARTVPPSYKKKIVI
jgi:hypothetical protein